MIREGTRTAGIFGLWSLIVQVTASRGSRLVWGVHSVCYLKDDAFKARDALIGDGLYADVRIVFEGADYANFLCRVLSAGQVALGDDEVIG